MFVITNDKNLVNKSCICKINATNFNGLKLNILNWIKTDKKSTGLQKPASPTHLNINNNTTTSSSSSSSSTKSTKLILNLNQQQNENINIKTSSSLVPFMFSPTSTTSFTSSPSSNSSTSSESTTNENHNSNSTSSNAKELPLIGSQIKPNLTKSTRHQDNFGYSLLASYCEKFVFEYVLHGTSDRSFLNDLHQRLVFSKQNSILDSKIDESMYIVVDVDSFDIMVYSSENTEYHQVENSIKMVDDMVKSALNMIKLFQNSEFVLLHLEDLLQEFYIKSITLNQLMSSYSDEKTIMELMEYVLLLIFLFKFFKLYVNELFFLFLVYQIQPI